jgi:HAD superfamily hydrolase (TIGR01549 family)
MRTFETVFLDAGGVLVWPNWHRVADVLRAHGVSADPRRLIDADPRARVAIDRSEPAGGSTDQRRGSTLFELVFAEAGVAMDNRTLAAVEELQAYHRERNLWESVPPFVAPALQDLRSAGYRMVIVSNSNGTLHRLFDRVGLSPLVDVIVDSHVEQVEKPERRFFDIALDRSGARREATVHVGDLYHVDVAGARAAGLAAVLIDEAGLRPDADCPRLRDVSGLPALLTRWTKGSV